MSDYRDTYQSWTKDTDYYGYLHFNRGVPCDDRIVCWDQEEAKTKTAGRRYRGLRIYILSESKEYWFKDGTGNGDLLEYHPWSSDITNAINQLKADKPWMSDIPSDGGSGSGSGSSTTTFIVSGSEHTKDELPTYLNEQVASPQTGQEVNVVFREDNVDSFMKFIYINNGWAILDGTQTISFSIPAYGTAEWDSLTDSDTDSLRYVKGEQGAITVYVKHGFCTQCVDTTLYQTGSEVDEGDTDDTTDAYGEELLVSKKCVTLSGRGGYWVKLELQIPTTSPEPTTTNYTLLLQR